MGFEYAKLKGKIKEKCGTQANFAEAIHISSVAVSDKLNNKSQWTQKEIDAACEVLELEKAEIPAYFFEAKVKVL